MLSEGVTMRKLLLFLVLAVIAAGIAIADTSVTGKWTGSFNMIAPDGQSKDGTALLLLKQSGTEITGSVGPDEGEQHPITKGKIEGEKITLLVEDEGRTIKFDLVLAAERITGDVNMTREGEAAKAKIDVTRAK
jgi:hypothetical protein